MVIIKRRVIWRYLVGCSIYFDSTLYENRLRIGYTFSRLTPGSTMWQKYKKGLWQQVLTFNRPLQPQKLMANKPELPPYEHRAK